ncbi:hypothetical protein J2N86_14525 (plasmid) [Legionella lytica]|uniref:Secreted protein n=1 Tax=Legionella lytica TaxID=96232 RepID=A0ABY4YCT7_9GAMM|nr:hypothetical protein [Legionella lytica]USQ15453.1 hypothetical protein J2N86_14525 [Legionella lytica]
MMKIISAAALCLFTTLSGVSFAGNAYFSINFKKTFCDNQEFLGNGAKKRPHLHCGTTYISYKKANGDHSNITEMGDCTRTNAVFDDIKFNRTAFANYEAIYNALVSYHQAGCPNQ